MSFTERALTVIEVDGRQAQDKLKALENQLEKLVGEKKKLSKEPLTDPKLLKQVDREIAQTRKEMGRYKKEIVDVRNVMNNLSGASLKQLEAAYRRVNAERKGMARGTKDYLDIIALEKKLKIEIDKANGALRQRKPLLTKMSDGFAKFGGMATALLASWAGVVLGAKSAIDSFLELDEKLADVRKTTGLTEEGVRQLSDELAKIDTRTSQLELLDLARVAGKLGITAQEEIIGFVNASNQIAVALSEDLGGNVEEAVNQLGKLVEIFDIKDEYGIEQALLKIGSTINSLGAAGTANEAYMIEFAKRVGGIAPMAGISIDKIMGLGATLDELGQTAEVSGTTLTDVIGSMFKDTASYAAIAGMSIEDFSALMNTDANEAFIKVLEGAKGTSGGFQQLALNLDALGIDGSRSIGVLSVLANNIDLLRERQAFANDEFVRGASLTDEYNVKNETATAKLEKAKKKFKEISVELGQKLQPIMTSIVSKASMLIKSIMAMIDVFTKYKGVIVPLVLALGTYWAVLKVAALWTTITTKLQIALSAATVIYRTAVDLLTGRLKLATFWQEKFNKVSRANLYAALAAAIIAAASAINMFIKRQREQLSIAKSVEREMIGETIKVNALFSALTNANASQEQRAKLMNEINTSYGQYLPYLITEENYLKKAAEARDLVIAGLRKEALARARQERAVEIQKRMLELQDKIAGNDEDIWNEILNKGSKFLGGGVNPQIAIWIDEYSRLAKTFDELMNNITDAQLEMQNSNPQNAPDNNDDNPVVTDDVNKNITKNAAVDFAAIQREANFELEQQIAAANDTLNTGLDLYEQYLDGRKSADETYNAWKTSFDKKNSDDEKTRQKAWFDEYMAELDKQQAEAERDLELRYAQGLLTEEEYENQKLAIKAAALVTEKQLRVAFAQEMADVDERMADHALTVEQLKFQRIKEEREKREEEEKKKLTEFSEKAVDIANQMGEALGTILADSTKSAEQKTREFGKEMLKIALTQLRNTLAIAIAERTIKSISQKSYWGILEGAALSALMTGAYTFAMSKIESMADGGYAGYTGAGRKYDKGPMVQLHRGEYVVPQEGMNNPNIARVISVIESARRAKSLNNLNFSAIPMAQGGYSPGSKQMPLPAGDSQLVQVISMLSDSIDSLSGKFTTIEAYISYDKMQTSDSIIETSTTKSLL